ncbi:MAG: hypothetical protein LBL57_07755 [Tannerella sp.]|jgi:hypothetical protein|nr:hypothetical protein [Tannerella sp.]
MKEVRIEYRRWGIFRKRIDLRAPESWIDLTAGQFATCAKVHTDRLQDEDFIAGFFGTGKRIARRLTKFEQYRLIELANFAADPKSTVNFFYIEKIRCASLFAPEKKLHGITIEHFMLFDTFFFDYLNEPNDDNLAKFIACLYLKGRVKIMKWKTVIEKEKVTEVDFSRRVELISRCADKSTQYAIFLNYTFVRKWLAKAFPLLFVFREPGDDDGKPSKRTRRKQPAASPGKRNRPDWVAIFDNFVGDDIIHYDRYRQIPCTLVFRQINRRIADYNKLKYGKK